MDAKNLLEQNRKQSEGLNKEKGLNKNAGLNIGGVRVENNNSDDLSAIMALSEIDVNEEQNMSFDSQMIEENKQLLKAGLDQLDGYDEREIILDGSDERLSVKSFEENPMLASRTRLGRYMKYPQMMGEGQVEAGDILGQATSKVVKNGAFDPAMIATGQAFMNRLTKWATEGEQDSKLHSRYLDQSGAGDILNCLYVDGMPIREFISEKYGYNGNRSVNKDKAIVSAYAAMIASRMNHPITLVRPVIINGVADVDIRNVGVDMRVRGKWTSRGRKIDAIRYGFGGEEYRKYCETAFRSSQRAKAGAAFREVKGKTIPGLNRLAELNENLRSAGKGKHANYDEFLVAFNRYFDALNFIGLDPDHMEVNKEDLDNLYAMSREVVEKAGAYLKGKKMNLPRHNAVKDIRDLASSQSGAMWGVIRNRTLNDENPTINLQDLLNTDQSGFVFMGLSDEIEDYSDNQTINGNNNIEYVKVDQEIALSLRSKKSIRIRNTIFNDDTATKAYQKLVQAKSNPDMDTSSRMVLAGTFLKAAANALYSDERFRKDINSRYAYATDNLQYLLCIVAREQLTKVLANDFKFYPELRDAMEMWNEEVASQEAEYMTYKSNVLGDKVSSEEFKKYGGSTRHRYVTVAEANDVIASSKMYLCAKKVAGKKGMFELRPSMPEYATLNMSQPLEQPIPLRKTFKAVYKTIASIIMDEKGNFITNIAPVNGESVTRRIDEMLLTLPETKADMDRAKQCAESILRPAMEKMLAADYKRKGTKNATAKAREDAAQICRDFMTLMEGNRGPLMSSYDATFHSFRLMMDTITKTTVDDLMKESKIKDFKIEGVAPTRAEVEEAFNEVKQEVALAKQDFTKLRNMDLDDEEVPLMSSCNENCRGTQILMLSHTDNGSYDSVAYNYADKAKDSPDEILDYMMTNMEKIFATGFGSPTSRNNHRKRLNELSESRQKNGKLTKNEVNDLRNIYRNYVKYDYHRGANMGQVGNAQYTLETFALEPDQVIQSPLTFNGCIGKYKSDLNEQQIDDEGGFIEHEGMKKFYGHENGMEFCDSRIKLIKGQLKDVFRVKVDKIREQY